MQPIDRRRRHPLGVPRACGVLSPPPREGLPETVAGGAAVPRVSVSVRVPRRVVADARRTVPTMIGDRLIAICGGSHVDIGDAVSDDLSHDEALGLAPVRPLAVARPSTSDEVADIVRAAAELAVPVTARGSGTGLSG